MEVITISDSDDSSRSGFTTKSRGQEKSDLCENTRKRNIRGRAGNGKKEQMTLNSGRKRRAKENEAGLGSFNAPAVSQRRRRRKKNEAVLGPFDAPAVSQRRRVTKKKNLLEKKESPICVNEEIPQAIIRTIELGLFGFHAADYDIHSSLRGKKAIIYGLTGYFPLECSMSLTDPRYEKIRNTWKSFCKNRIMDPVYEFVEGYEGLKAKGIDQILFLPLTYNVTSGLIWHHPKLSEKYGFVRFASDLNAGRPGVVSYYDCLGLKVDIKEQGMDKPRSRRFILVVDDLKVKLASIESINGEFTIPSADEIVQAAFAQ